MERQDVCILINSTPRYYDIVSLQVLLIRRYASRLQWPVYFATEDPTHPVCQLLKTTYGVNLLTLDTKTESGFLESREAGLHLLPSDVKYVLMLQDDFLLDREPMYKMLAQACSILDMDRSVASLRLMPCPGPVESDPAYHPDMKHWRILTENDQMLFTYQATLWRKFDAHTFYKGLLDSIAKDFPAAVTAQEKKDIALKMNCAETHYGQEKLRAQPHLLHLAWARTGAWPNAVFLCPFPYRPTAIVKGKLEPFAAELAKREGFGTLKFE